MTFISKFVILSLVVTLFYFIGLLTFVIDYEENTCEMTYMFEYPQFVKIKLQWQDSFPRYGLYAYSEGKLTERARAMRFEGIPVLFVPGNAGSFKQVRSLASVALRKALNSRVGYHFDFFTLDLNGELSGLNGAVLEEQTLFLNHSLHRILELYDKKRPNEGPTSVVVIGHSMGGVIAERLYESSDLIKLLITLSSPHTRPPIMLDPFTAKYYDVKQSQVENKTLVTIAGGYQDHLVLSWLTNSNLSSLNVITSAIPKVWLSTDHACITWCKQFILATIRSLFDAVDLKTKQISTNPQYRLSVFKHHMLHNSGTNVRWAERYKVLVRFDDKGQWIEDDRQQFSISLDRGTNSNLWYMIKIEDNSKFPALFVMAENLAVTDWIFACEANKMRGNMKYCENGIHLSHLSQIAPSTKTKRRIHYLNLVTLKKRFPKITHIVVRVLPTQEPVALHFDLHSPPERSVPVTIPRWFHMGRTPILGPTERGIQRYELSLQGLTHVVQAYQLYVEPHDCGRVEHHATAALHVPWGHQDKTVIVSETSRRPLHIRLHSSRDLQSNQTPSVILNLDPTCQYTISVRPSLLGMAGQFARIYSPLLIANVAAVLLMSFRSQLISLEEKGYCCSFQSSLSMSTKPYYLITGAKLIGKMLGFLKLPNLIPIPDSQILIDENIDFLLLPLLLYITSVGLLYLLSLAFWFLIIMNESTVHKFVGKAFSRTVGKNFRMSEWFLNALHRVPCVVAVTLFCLGFTTCGGLGLSLGLAYYFLKLSQLGEDFVEGLIYRHVKKVVKNIAKNLFKTIGNILFSRFMKKYKTDQKSENALAIENNVPKLEQTKENLNEIEDKTIENQLETVKDDEKQMNKGSGDQTDEEQTTKTKDLPPEQPETSDTQKTSADVSEISEDQSEPEIRTESSQLNNVTNELRLRKVVETNDTQLEQRTLDQVDKTESELQKTVRQMFEAPDNSELHFHFTLFLLWLLLTALSAPSVLTWAHNFKLKWWAEFNKTGLHCNILGILGIRTLYVFFLFRYNNILSPDPYKIFSVVMCGCAVPLWQFEFPRPNKKYYKELSMFMYVSAMLCLIYTPLHLYRLAYVVSTVFVVTLLHQLFAPSYPEEETPDSDDHVDPIALIHEIKAKME